MFAETEDQELFERATARFLETHYPMTRVRALAAERSTFEPARWREAAQLGWTTLLVPEAAGGGSISGNGLAAPPRSGGGARPSSRPAPSRSSWPAMPSARGHTPRAR
jgi:alkylation response protein AidB-like acyl-CoA dehydrogenase